MGAPFDLLRVGDAMCIDAVEYVASGHLTLRTSDGDEWREWLLVPRGVAPAEAVRSERHRWLSREPGEGLRLWTPIALPPALDPARLKPGQSQRFRDRDYRVEDRYRFHATAMFGDVGGDAAPQEAFDGVDLRGGPLQLSIEWNARSTDATLGRQVGSHELIQWSRQAGGKFAERVGAATTRKATAARTFDKQNPTSFFTADATLWQWVAGAVMVLLIVALESCDDDCERRTNPATGQYQTYCDDGMHSSGHRNFGSWGGK
jgi:hypothetical protein